MVRRAGFVLATLCSAVNAQQTTPPPPPTAAPATTSALVPTLVPPRSPAATVDTSPSIRIGERVKLWQRVANTLSVPLKGTVTSLLADSVGVRPNGLATPVVLSRQSITGVEISKGPRSGSRLTSTLTGILIGGLSGAALGLIGGNVANKNAAKASYLGAAVGVVVGGGLGYALPGEGWQHAQLPPTAPATAP